MKTIDIFMDIENIGLGEDIGRSRTKAHFISTMLPPALAQEGYVLGSVTCFASYYHGRRLIHRRIQRGLAEALGKYGWKLFWSSCIADDALIRHVQGLLAQGNLASAVMITTNDHDFLKLAHQLRAEGRTVLIAGERPSKSFEGIADKVISFWDWLGGHPERISPDALEKCSRTIPNQLPL